MLHKILSNILSSHRLSVELVANQQPIRTAKFFAKILYLVMRIQQYEAEIELHKLGKILNQKYDQFAIRFGHFIKKIANSNLVASK